MTPIVTSTAPQDSTDELKCSSNGCLVAVERTPTANPLQDDEGTPQRRSIFPMRYQSSDSLPSPKAKAQPAEEESFSTPSTLPQSAVLFPSNTTTTSTTSSLSFRLPPQSSQLVVPPRDMDGYTHSFYDLKATAVTTTQCAVPETPRPFWDSWLRLLPWVSDEPPEQDVQQETVLLGGKSCKATRTRTEDPMMHSEGSISSVEEDDFHNHEDENTHVLAPKRPSSILRRSRFSSERMATPVEDHTSSSSAVSSTMTETDVPSLASDSDSSITSSCSSQALPSMVSLPRPARRSVSEPCGLSKRATFDPRICVRQFNRSQEELKSTWFSPAELCNFRKEALQRILQTSKGRFTGRAVFSHQALGIHFDEIQDILIVDAHDICANLFAKGLASIFPHARILKARSTGEATQLLQQRNFDMIVVEERLKMFHRQESPASGSCLLSTVRNKDRILLVGVSAHLAEDASKLTAAGVDVLWTKPPPRMDDDLRKSLLMTLLAKRNSTTVLSSS